MLHLFRLLMVFALGSTVLVPAHAEASLGCHIAEIRVQVVHRLEPRVGNSFIRSLVLDAQDFRNSISGWIQEVLRQHELLRQDLVNAGPDDKKAKDEVMRGFSSQLQTYLRRPDGLFASIDHHLDILAAHLNDAASASLVGAERTKLIWVRKHLNRLSERIDTGHLLRADSWARLRELSPQPPQ